MSLTSLPIEIIAEIFNLLDESKPKKPCKALIALRLTCRKFEEIASRPLFRTFCLSPTLESWTKLLLIPASQKVRVHLQIIAFEDGDFICSGDWHDNNTSGNEQGMESTLFSSDLYFLDLSLLSNLKVLKAKDCWLITKKPRSNVEIPWGHCRIDAISYRMPSKQPAFWNVLGGLAEITRYDFEISSLNCELSSAGPCQSLFKLDFSGLKYLRLYFQADYSSTGYDLSVDLNILARLQNLPNLEEFRLDQFYGSDPSGDSSLGTPRPIRLGNGPRTETSIFLQVYLGNPFLTVHHTTNVLKKLRHKNWPRLRHLGLRSLYTTVADFQAFTEPHAGSLKSFRLRNELRWVDATAEEKLRRRELPHWIQTVLCPGGGGARVKILGQAEGDYVCED